MRNFSGIFALIALLALVLAGCSSNTNPVDNSASSAGKTGYEIKADAEAVNSIGNFVWDDLNKNGIQDDGEPGIAGVDIFLHDCDLNFVAWTATDENGFYRFEDLPAGDYLIGLAFPVGYELTTQNAGDDDTKDSDFDTNIAKTVCFSLGEEENNLTIDAGFKSILEPEPDKGCTQTIGYWKTHAGFPKKVDDVTPLLPLWLGSADGEYSYQVTTAPMAVNFLKQNYYGEPSNGITKLYAQLLAAKLNIAAGADDSEVADIITAADDFLAEHSYTDWNLLVLNDYEFTKTVNYWHDTLDDYNNGFIGPGHCDDYKDDGTCKFK